MKIKNKLKICMILLVGVLLISFSSAYMRSSPQYSQFSGGGYGGQYNSNRAMCEAGQDFVVQIAPFGCTPAVVRSDLLEEQNVPVFCQLAATKMNPLIDVDAIEHISFSSGQYPPEVSGIGFHPAKAALGVRGNLNSPVLDNIGYAVVVLKQQRNESSMPEYVEGNMTARLTYDIKNAFGVGKTTFYLPELTDSEWSERYLQYGFWRGKGYLKAEVIEGDSASISVYLDEDRKIKTVNLNERETSAPISLPGFDCLATMQLRLDDLTNSDTRVKLNINGDTVEVVEREKFLDNKCYVVGGGIDKKGARQKVEIRCMEDDKTRRFELSLSPQIQLMIGGQKVTVGLGDFLYSTKGEAVYLGFIGSNSDNYNKEDLYVMLLKTPESKEKLSEEELEFMGDYNGYFENVETGSDFAGDVATLGKNGLGISTAIGSYFAGKHVNALSYGESKDIFEQEVSIVGFLGSGDLKLEESSEYSRPFEKNYDGANQDYETLTDVYSGENYEDITYGEEALYKQILLNYNSEQKRKMLDLCLEFRELYSDSKKDLTICDDDYTLSNQDTASIDVSINGEAKTISFRGIYQPSFDDYGVVLRVKGPNGNSDVFNLKKEQIISLEGLREENKGDSKEYIKLVDLDQERATVRVNLNSETKTKSVTGYFFSDDLKLEEDVGEAKNGYVFTLVDINLKQNAKVSILPRVENTGTEVNFNFKIGIDKRDIKLSPEKTAEKIKSLNKTITDWSDKSEKLGGVVKGLKTACLATGVGLTLKNLISNAGGKAIARQKVMRGSGGWYEKCAEMISSGMYSTEGQCLSKEASVIEEDVNAYYKVLKEQNEEIKSLQEGVTEKNFFKEKFVDTDSFMEKYSGNVASKVGALGTLKNPNGDGEIDLKKLKTSLSYESWKNSGNYDIEQLRDIDFYVKQLEQNPDDEVAKKRLYSELSQVEENSKLYVEKDTMASNLDIQASSIGFLEVGKKVKKLPYKGLTYKDIKNKIIINERVVEDDTPVQILQTSQGKKYIVVLDGSAGTDNLNIKYYNPSEEKGKDFSLVYDESGNLIDGGDIPKELKNVYFKKYDASAYENVFKSVSGETKPMIKYYETEPYKGLPALVPFDLDKGWYASTKPTLPVLGGMKSYDESGRVTSFYVCNVGENGIAEVNSGFGDDDCEMINFGTGQPYNEFPGLSKSEASKVVKVAQQAIEDASRAYKPGVKSVLIKDLKGKKNRISVGSPAADTPDVKCQDFMSPTECKVLFNVCDPVICPSSRCDFGGAYPVKDVIQSGIIGSIALCLPNYKEGIIVPVCLSGIKAGIDGLLSVMTSYRDCLQHSLDTGEMVGVCDEIYSIHMCEFFWRQSLPLARLAIPKVMEFVTGQNVHGGGEYLGVASAWETAEKSVSYFTTQYAENSFKAFKARTAEDVGGAVCENFVSARYPNGGNILDALTDPDSPPQFHGRFDEIPFTTATNPPISQYKVFYHVYAGTDSRAFYQIYLRGGVESSYYQDTSNRRIVGSGYINPGDYASETRDFTAPSGYKEMCIVVNGQEECGFKQVTTSAFANYVKDQYMAEQAGQIDVKTESSCISGTVSLYSLASPSLQGAADEMVNPAIYNRGIIRICATGNPGKGTDAKEGTNESRWKDVGYCGDKKLRCWLDTESVENVIDYKTTENQVLEKVNENYQEVLKQEGRYLREDEMSGEIEKIKLEDSKDKRLELINSVMGKAFFNSQKSELILLRGNTYAELAKELFSDYKASLIKKNAVDMKFNEGDISYEESDPDAEIVDWEKKIVFEFQDGTFYKNLLYRYDEWGWHVSRNNDDWFNVGNLEGENIDVERFLALINGLKDSDYVEGVGLLIEWVVYTDKNRALKISNEEDDIKLRGEEERDILNEISFIDSADEINRYIYRLLRGEEVDETNGETPGEYFSEVELRDKIIELAEDFKNKQDSGKTIIDKCEYDKEEGINCFTVAEAIYEKAGANKRCVYSLTGDEVNFEGRTKTLKEFLPSKIECSNNERDKHNFKKGDLIQYYNDNDYGGEHNAIFDSWVASPSALIANVYSFSGLSTRDPLKYHSVNFKKYPLTIIWEPVSKSGTTVSDDEESDEGGDFASEEEVDVEEIIWTLEEVNRDPGKLFKLMKDGDYSDLFILDVDDDKIYALRANDFDGDPAVGEVKNNQIFIFVDSLQEEDYSNILEDLIFLNRKIINFEDKIIEEEKEEGSDEGGNFAEEEGDDEEKSYEIERVSFVKSSVKNSPLDEKGGVLSKIEFVDVGDSVTTEIDLYLKIEHSCDSVNYYLRKVRWAFFPDKHIVSGKYEKDIVKIGKLSEEGEYYFRTFCKQGDKTIGDEFESEILEINN
jgi:hypothetical protein